MACTEIRFQASDNLLRRVSMRLIENLLYLLPILSDISCTQMLLKYLCISREGKNNNSNYIQCIALRHRMCSTVLQLVLMFQ